MTTSRPVDATSLTRLGPFIKSELHRLSTSGTLTPAGALQQVCTQLFGTECSREEQVRFMLFAAPLARRIVIELASVGDRIGTTDISVSDLKQWLWWLDRFDPLCARMIDLHYFAGLSTKETAAALRMSPQVVIRDLRFAKAWLQARLL